MKARDWGGKATHPAGKRGDERAVWGLAHPEAAARDVRGKKEGGNVTVSTGTHPKTSWAGSTICKGVLRGLLLLKSGEKRIRQGSGKNGLGDGVAGNAGGAARGDGVVGKRLAPPLGGGAARCTAVTRGEGYELVWWNWE